MVKRQKYPLLTHVPRSDIWALNPIHLQLPFLLLPRPSPATELHIHNCPAANGAHVIYDGGGGVLTVLCKAAPRTWRFFAAGRRVVGWCTGWRSACALMVGRVGCKETRPKRIAATEGSPQTATIATQTSTSNTTPPRSFDKGSSHQGPYMGNWGITI